MVHGRSGKDEFGAGYVEGLIEWAGYLEEFRRENNLVYCFQ